MSFSDNNYPLHLPIYSFSEMAGAKLLTFSSYYKSYTTDWDNIASYYSYGTTHSSSTDSFKIWLTEGATYSFSSGSDSDPDELVVYDSLGTAVVENYEWNDFSLVNGYKNDVIKTYEAKKSGWHYIDAGWVQGKYSKSVYVSVLEDLNTVESVEGMSLYGDYEANTLYGGAGADKIYSSSGNDSIYGGHGGDVIFAGDGVDSVYYSQSNSYYSVKPGSLNNFYVYDSTGNTFDTLYQVERIHFSNGVLALDTDGDAGQVYRLYQAAFNRKPDSEGLGYWIKMLDEGTRDLSWVAEQFIGSQEFANAYGTLDTVSDDRFVGLLYSNVLSRNADNAGIEHWKGQLNGGVKHESVLIGFSESTENQQNLAADIQNGIWYV